VDKTIRARIMTRMADQQRYSEEEVYSILREAVRIPQSEAQNGFTREQIARFAADAGISDGALEQSLAKHRGRRRAKLVEHTRKTTLTLDWELSQVELDNIAATCEALPPHAYKSMGNYTRIRIDQWGFYSMISILRQDGFTHISIDRERNLELLISMAIFAIAFPVALFLITSAGTAFDVNGNPITKPIDLTPLAYGLVALSFVIAWWMFGSRVSTARRRILAEQFVSDLGANLL